MEQTLAKPMGSGILPGPLLEIGAATFATNFGTAPFLIRHRLADHPLFEMARLVELSRRLPEASVEFNAGDVAVNQNPDATPRTGLSAEETLRRIEECRSWMVLKNVEQDPVYADLLNRCLLEVESRGHPYGQGVGLREGFVFVSSPGAVTPYHMDPELNFLLQVRGTKVMHVYPGWDCPFLTEEELERFYAGAHRNLTFREEYQEAMATFELTPGVGLHVPVTTPHWVRVGPGVSVSFSITFQTRATERRGILYRVHHGSRARGRPLPPVGASPLWDAWHYHKYRIARRLGLRKG